MYTYRLKFILLNLVLFCFLITSIQAQIYLENWGLADYHDWPILNDSSTAAGYASIGGETKDDWASLRGSFGQTVIASLDSAVIVRGQLEFVGDGLGPSGNAGLRYALTWQENEGILEHQYTDSASWSVIGDHYGYEFTPNSGYLYSYPGTVWTIIDSNWASTWSNNGWAISYLYQVPYPAEIVEGVYDWAISVQPLADGTNEVRWYLQHTDKASYWFAGIAIDTAQVITKFNGICFGIGSIVSENLTQFNLKEVQFDKGDPIEIPLAPWLPYYIDKWGLSDYDIWGMSEYDGWPILNDSTTAAGDAAMGGQTKDWWATIRGSFGQMVEASLDSAVIVSGRLELVGADMGIVYAPLRYALTWQEDEGILENQYTDSAAWSVNGGHYGYQWTPRTGPDVYSGGSAIPMGTLWTIDNGNWASSYYSNGWDIALGDRVPQNAELVEGIYDWAISVQPLANGTNEIRWYLQHEDKESYWYMGIAIDTAQVTTKFNGICFGVGPDVPETLTRFNLTKVQVDKGDPFEIPEAPFQKFYITQWGLAEYHSWPILNDSTTAPGYASIGGEFRDGTASLRGGFGQDVQISKEKAIIVSGQIEFVGGSGGDVYTPVRYALTHQADEGELLYVGTDSAQWSVGSKHFGYLFTPRSGKERMASGSGGYGTVWNILNANWASTWSGSILDPIFATVNQAPHNAEIVAGAYNFAISVHAVDDSTNEIRWYMVEENEKYWFAGRELGIATTTRFNGIQFGIFNEVEWTQFNVIDMQVDLGDPLSDIYIGPSTTFIDEWGIIGDRFGGWITTPGEWAGNVSISGEVPNNGLTAVRGGFFDLLTPLEGYALILEGELELDNGGFEAANSLRFGIFYSDDPGILVTQTPDSLHWTGSENKHSGYLFIPTSGTNNSAFWGTAAEPGNWGAVVNNVWFEPQADSNYAMGTAEHYPSDATAGKGTYDFQISISSPDSGGREIRFKLIKEDETYGFAGIAVDKHDLIKTNYFNCISFALDSGNTTTALHLRDVRIDMGNPITLPDWVTSVKLSENRIPTKFFLSQNYPNPFNPITKISYSVPKNSYISIKIYNLLGQEVATLFEGQQKAGHHITVFDGSMFTSGVYFYRLESDNFSDTKKLILLK